MSFVFRSRVGRQSSPAPGRLCSLATTLAERFAAIAPEGFSCVAYDTTVILTREILGLRGLDMADAPDWSEESWADDLRAVIWQMLSDFQDEIVHQLGAAWPPIPGGSGLATPRARIEDNTVRGWYGTDDTVVVALKAIPIEDDRSATEE